MKFLRSSNAKACNPTHQIGGVKSWRSNRGYMFAMMLAMLALMAAMGVGLSRLLMTTKATTQMQRVQDNKQLLNSVIMTLSTKAVDGDSDNVLESPAFSTETITGFTAPTDGGFVDTDVANTDAWGRRLGYCAYDYGSAAVTASTGTGRIRGNSASSPTDSWVAVVVISAGPDGVITTPCPAADSVASSVTASGDDMVAARSYGEMVSFGNAQIASTLSGMGTNTSNKLCRLGSDGKMVCDISTTLTNSNTANRFCRTNASGVLECSTSAATCGAGQLSKWNGSNFECVNTRSAGCYWKNVEYPSYSLYCRNWEIEYVAGIGYEGGIVNGIRKGAWSSDTDIHIYPEVDKILCCRLPAQPAYLPANCGTLAHGSTWSESCPSGLIGTRQLSCNDGVTTETANTCRAIVCTTQSDTWTSGTQMFGGLYSTFRNGSPGNSVPGVNNPYGLCTHPYITNPVCNNWSCDALGRRGCSDGSAWCFNCTCLSCSGSWTQCN